MSGSVPFYPKTEVGLSTPEFICYKSATSKIEQALNYNPRSCQDVTKEVSGFS
ncbi:hypothetical protein [Streptococcus anginosus]|uniref:hypothetical protein n=1 Tax=Streptococcus anginosus TaxID=1328 RepID=UPI001897C0D5|nr:hypothetical protein [Streptococcus anginosus]MDB8657952.1 hypothetical protein [Streptococcus anginosus]